MGDACSLRRPPTVLLELPVDPPKKAEGGERFGAREGELLVIMGIMRLPLGGGAIGRKYADAVHATLSLSSFTGYLAPQLDVPPRMQASPSAVSPPSPPGSTDGVAAHSAFSATNPNVNPGTW